MESNLVIKVKYGDTLRRFNAHVNENDELDLDMDGLRAKILVLFNFPPDADLTLRYIDEDGDVVTLVDDEDLRDVRRQHLKFLRIDVHLNNEKVDKSYARSSGSSTPMRSPRVQPPLMNTNTHIHEVLKSLPEPLNEAFTKLSLELASRAASSSPVLAELVDCISKVGKPFLSSASRSQSGVDLGQTGGDETLNAPSVVTDPNTSTNVTGGLVPSFVPVSLPVDLNEFPTCESNQSGRVGLKTVGPVAPNLSAVGNKKKSKESDCHLSFKPVGASASSCVDPVMPSKDVPHTSRLGGNLSNECPFRGMALPSESIEPLSGDLRNKPSKRSYKRPDAMVGMFHKGVRCDSCGVHPITGPRFKSKVKADYDLCSICFAEMGNEEDYIRIDRPISHWQQRPCRGLFNHMKLREGIPVPPHILRNFGMKPDRLNLDSSFVLDVNVLDGTMMAPSTPFTKMWRMRNSGSIAWPKGIQLVCIGGDKFSDLISAPIEIPADGVPVGVELDIAVDFKAPELPGRYISYWRMESPSGTKFGQRVWVLIEVDASLEDSICNNSIQELNLNLPPAGSGSRDTETVDVNVKAVVDPIDSSTVTVTVERLNLVEEQPEQNEEQEVPIMDGLSMGLGFPVSAPEEDPISESLLVGHGASASAPPQPPPLSLYPIIDLSEAVTVEPSDAPGKGVPVPSDTASGNDVEQALLKELEEMGFKQVDLNKEILRMNEYNLEQSVDDLCGVAEWDPILEELQEMGFCDVEENKRLLKKNNGSIKRVVMDLLTGEKA